MKPNDPAFPGLVKNCEDFPERKSNKRYIEIFNLIEKFVQEAFDMGHLIGYKEGFAEAKDKFEMTPDKQKELEK